MIFQRNKKSSDLASRFSFKISGNTDSQAVTRGMTVSHKRGYIFSKNSYLPLLLGGLLTIFVTVGAIIYFKSESVKAWWTQYTTETVQQNETTKIEDVSPSNAVSTPEVQETQSVSKEQQLNALTAQYQALLQSSELSVETFKGIHQQVKNLDADHSLLTFPGLADAFTRETEKAIKNKRFEQAHQLLQDWKSLLPEQTPYYTSLNEKMLTGYLKAGESYFQERMQAILSDDNLTMSKIEQAQQQLTELHKLVKKRQQVETYDQQIETALKTQQLDEARRLIDRLRALDPKLPTLPLLTQQLASASNPTDEKSAMSTPLPVPESQTVAIPADKTSGQIRILLQTCAEHLQANRLTSGQGGTAFTCYHEVLTQDPSNNEAKQGVKAIETRYVGWAEEALIAGRLQEASQHLARLAQVNPESPLLLKLQEQLNQPTPKNIQDNGIDALLKTCADHFAAKRLTSGKQGTAFDCYQQVLKQDPDNVAAKKGLQSIEETYIHWVNSALANNNVQRAQLFLQKLQQVNPKSSALSTLQQQLTTLKQSQTKKSTSEQDVKKINTVPVTPSQKHSPQQPVQKEKNVATKQTTQPRQQTATPKAVQSPTQECNELFSQESLGIVPLTNAQKTFQRQHCR